MRRGEEGVRDSERETKNKTEDIVMNTSTQSMCLDMNKEAMSDLGPRIQYLT